MKLGREKRLIILGLVAVCVFLGGVGWLWWETNWGTAVAILTILLGRDLLGDFKIGYDKAEGGAQ